MVTYTISINYPSGSVAAPLPSVYSVPVKCNKKERTIYDAIEELSRVYYKKRKPCQGSRFAEKPLAHIINLHNCEGIQDFDRIQCMLLDIKCGEEILMGNGLPNIKLVPTAKGELVLFDGHHSLIAYLLAGRKLVHEVPHIIVAGSKTGHVTDTEMSDFFGIHSCKVRALGWENYALNWQAPEEKQLCHRIQKNMAELVSACAKVLIKTAL